MTAERGKPLPRFRTGAQERAFWETEGRDATRRLDWAKAQRVVLPNHKPSTKTISLRLPQHLLDAIKSAANARDVPHASILTMAKASLVIFPPAGSPHPALCRSRERCRARSERAGCA